MDNLSNIDKAIQAATARKEAKSGEAAPAAETTTAAPAKTPRPRLSDEEKAARQAQRDQERATRRAAREEMRAAKRAAREAEKRTPHMSKVAKAAEKLPSLNDQAQITFNDMVANFSASQLAALAAHLVHFNRVQATERALTQKVGEGDTVRVTSGDPRYIGKEGTVAKVQRIRCYVTIEGAKKPVYLFTSDVEVLAAAAQPVAATG